MTRHSLALTTVAILAVGLTSTYDLRAQRAPSGTWITAWGTSQNGLATNPITNATVRMIGRVTIPGDSVRVRLDNTFGQNPVRTKASFDGIIDFDRVVRDPVNADLMAPAFNCGDGIHPSPRGYYEMGKAVRLDLFKEGLKSATSR